MGIFSRNRDQAPIPPQPDPTSEGDSALAEGPSGSQSERQPTYTDVEELSEDYLRFLAKRGAKKGKYIRLDGMVYVSPGEIPGFAGDGLMHNQILACVMEKEGVKERILGAKALQGATKTALADGLDDAGKFNVVFRPEGETAEGPQGRFRVFGGSTSYGLAEKEVREETVQIAAAVLGPNIRVEEDPYKH